MLNGLVVYRGVPINGSFIVPAIAGIDFTDSKLQLLGKLYPNDSDVNAIINLTTENGGIVAVIIPTKITATYSISGQLTSALPFNQVVVVHYELNLTYKDERYSHVLEVGNFVVKPRIKVRL